jgi:hypothetical protein
VCMCVWVNGRDPGVRPYGEAGQNRASQSKTGPVAAILSGMPACRSQRWSRANPLWCRSLVCVILGWAWLLLGAFVFQARL